MSETIAAERKLLDVSTLLESSRPIRPFEWGWVGLAACAFLLVSSIRKSDESPEAVMALRAAAVFAVTVVLLMMHLGRRAKYERRRRQAAAVEGIEDLILLRQYEPAGIALDRLMSTPIDWPPVWGKAILQFIAVLNRQGRLEDSAAVSEFLLEQDLLDPPTDFGVRIGRAMVLFRDDRLVDGDRALSDVRRRVEKPGPAPLRLAEMYRDVKTGHPDDALATFASGGRTFALQAGHRYADFLALAAHAHDQKGDGVAAADHYRKATLLAPAFELCRRYPELSRVAGKYPACPAPPEAA